VSDVVKITVLKNGPLRVEGAISLVDAHGEPIETKEGKPVSLCRCGASSKKPFCDGTHNRISFDDTADPSTWEVSG